MAPPPRSHRVAPERKQAGRVVARTCVAMRGTARAARPVGPRATLARRRSPARAPGGPAAGRGSAREPCSPCARPRPSSRAARPYRDGPAARTARRTVAVSTMRPAYITATRSAVSAMTPRSCETRTSAMPVSRWSDIKQRQDLILDGDVQRRRRLVRQHQARLAGERQGDHRALQHAAGPVMRIVVEPAARRWRCRPGRAGRRRASRPRPIEAAVQAQRLDELIADRPDRIEAAHRALEDHGDAASAEPPLVLGDIVERGRGPRRRRRRGRHLGPWRGRARRGRTPTCRCPLSPTMPSVSPGADRRGRRRHWRGCGRGAWRRRHAEVLDLEQRRGAARHADASVTIAEAPGRGRRRSC